MDEQLATTEQLVSELMSPDNNVRKSAEARFEEFKAFPDILLLSLVRVARVSYDPQYRLMAALLTRNGLNRLWEKVSAMNQNNIKKELLEALVHEQDQGILKRLIDCVATLTTIIFAAHDTWSEMLQLMHTWTEAQEDIRRETSINLFSHLLQHQPEELQSFYPVLQQIFMKGLQDPSIPVRISALNGAATFIMLSPEHRDEFVPLTPQMVEIITFSLQRTEEMDARRGMALLIDMAELEPDFFKSSAENICNTFMQMIPNKDLEDTTRHMAIEFIVTLTESKPSMIRKLRGLLATFVPMLLQMLVEKEENPEWNNGEDSDLPDESAELAAETLDRLSIALLGKSFIPIIFEHVPGMLSAEPWQHRHAALMAISVVGEGSEKFLTPHLESILHMVLPTFQDPHPRVRWAACNTIGQMASDFGPYFQVNFHNSVLPNLVGVMDDVENPRVQAHAAAAIINFCEFCTPELLAPYLDAIIKKMVALLQQHNKIVLEQAITAVAAIADCVKETFVPYYDTFIPYLKSVLLKATTKEFSYLRGKAMEAISLIAVAVGKDLFIKDAKEVIDCLISTQSKPMEADDPQITFIQQAWARLCKALGQDFVPYLEFVIPPLLSSAKIEADVRVITSEEDLDDPEKWEVINFGEQSIGINNSVLTEKNSACNMLFCYAEELKEGFFPFVQEVVQIMVPLLKFYYHDGVRGASASTLPCLLRSTKLHFQKVNGDIGPVVELFQYLVVPLMEAIEKEMDIEVLAIMLSALAEAIDITGPSWATDASSMRCIVDLCKGQLEEFAKRREKRHGSVDEDELDQEDIEKLISDNEQEGDVLAQIAEIMGKALKHSKMQFMPFYEELLGNFLEFLDPNAMVQDHKVALWVCCDLVDYLGPDGVPYYSNFIGAVLNYMSDKEPGVRQAACYCIGVCAVYGGEQFKPILHHALTQLSNVINMENSRESLNVFATENAISSLGRILQFQGENLGGDYNNLLQVWLNLLPLLHDDDEGKVSHKYLLQFLAKDAQLVLGSGYENLAKIFSIFSQVMFTKLADDETSQQMVQILTRMQSEIPGPIIQGAFDALPMEYKEKLTKCVSGQH